MKATLRGLGTMTSACCDKAAALHEPIVDPVEFATLPDMGRCPDCTWVLHDTPQGKEVSIFHLLLPVGRHQTTLCEQSVGINEVNEVIFDQLPRERQCPECRALSTRNAKA